MQHNLHYNPRLQPNAKKLRNEMTKAEACLWKYVLRASSMKGYRFTRQRPVFNFIADFMCKELNLIIEVDGFTHTWEMTVAKDELKEAELLKAGFRTIRFSDDEVLTSINGVADAIRKVIEEIELQSSIR
jgi:very-short-patch-repair endonuclease